MSQILKECANVSFLPLEWVCCRVDTHRTRTRKARKPPRQSVRHYTKSLTRFPQPQKGNKDLSASSLTRRTQVVAHTRHGDRGTHTATMDVIGPSRGLPQIAQPIRAPLKRLHRNDCCFVQTRGVLQRASLQREEHTHTHTHTLDATNGDGKQQQEVPAVVDRAPQIGPLCQILVCGILLLDGTDTCEDMPRLGQQ